MAFIKTSLFLIGIVGGLLTCVNAQTPYDAFAPEQSNKKMLECTQEQSFLLVNKDTAATVRYLSFNTRTLEVKCFSKEQQEIVSKVLEPEDFKFITIDPLAEENYDISPYAYCANNPINYIDPTGLSHYSINPEGQIAMILETQDDFDQLFVVDSKGNINTDIDALRVNDRSILQGLSTARNDYNGNYAISNSPEVGAVFVFAANNSNVEWGLSAFEGDNFVLSTSHKAGAVSPATAINGFNENNMMFKVHSHPGYDGTKGASNVRGINDDMYNIIQMAHRFAELGTYTHENFPKHFVYHSHTNVLYQYTPYINSIHIGPVKKNILTNISNSTYSSVYKP